MNREPRTRPGQARDGAIAARAGAGKRPRFAIGRSAAAATPGDEHDILPRMLNRIVRIGSLLLALLSGAAPAVEPRAIWDNRCEHCHGDPTEFSGKYLWNVDGQLQGQHHIDDLDLFLRNHYLPDHMIEPINDMLLVDANSPSRFDAECGECHGSAADFVEKSLWIRGSGITGMETGTELDEFLPTHQGLEAEDVEFYLKLLVRVAESP